MNFTKANAKGIAAEVQEELKALAEKHGLSVSYKGGKFTSATFEMKIEFASVDALGESITREAEMFKLNARRVGLKADDLFAIFKDNMTGQKFKIMGFNNRNKKYKIIAQDVASGKTYKLAHQHFTKMFDRV